MRALSCEGRGTRLKVNGGFGFWRKQLNEFIDAGDFQSIFDEAGGASNPQSGSRFIDLSLADNEDTDTGAVQDGNPRKIKDNFLGLFGQDFRQFQLYVSRIVPQNNPSVHFKYGDIRRNLFALNAKDHLAPRQRYCDIRDTGFHLARLA